METDDYNIYGSPGKDQDRREKEIEETVKNRKEMLAKLPDDVVLLLREGKFNSNDVYTEAGERLNKTLDHFLNGRLDIVEGEQIVVVPVEYESQDKTTNTKPSTVMLGNVVANPSKYELTNHPDTGFWAISIKK